MAKKPEQTQQAVQQQLLLYQLLQSQLEELGKQGTGLQQRFVEVEATATALDDLKKSREGSEVLIPLGNGIYANGKLGKGDLLVNVGAGVMVRKPVTEAAALVQARRQEIEQTGERLQQEMMAVAARINAVGADLQQSLAEAKRRDMESGKA